MASTEEQGSFGAELVEVLKAENDPAVKRRLYQALRNQSDCDATEVVRLLRDEVEQKVRLTAFDTLASALPSTGTPETAAFFNQVATPELLQAALSAESSSTALEAVVTLRKARSSASLAALQQIADSTENAKVSEAARAAVEGVMKIRR